MAKEPFAAKLSAMWLGALFFWIFTGFSKKYTDLLSKKYETRNLITGYILTITFFLILIYFAYIKTD